MAHASWCRAGSRAGILLVVAVAILVAVPAVAAAAPGPRASFTPRLPARLTAAAIRQAVAPDDAIPGVPVLLPLTIADTLDPVTDVDDVYRVHLERGQYLLASLSGYEGTDFDLYVYPPGTPTGTPPASGALAGSTNPGTSEEELMMRAYVTGDYYIDVYCFGGSDPGAYALTATATAAFPMGPDDDVPGVPLSLPATVTGTLDDAAGPGPDADDVFRVSMVRGQILSARLTDIGVQDFQLYLYGPAAVSAQGNTALVYPPENAQAGSLLLYRAPAAGDYYLDLWAAPGSVGAYTLEASSTMAATTTITISRNTSAVLLPRPFILSGLLRPGRIGDKCVVEVQKPRSSRWSYSSARLAYATVGTAAKWWYRYTPRLRGTYWFRARFVDDLWRYGALSGRLSVVVR